ncbi:endonuclease/exonuclease/phosphatase family protein [Gorillibacterium massiliense]|uniref:endonuclease/exonuclease/phosphatase family protein n=1 Tax=Gorillibacterium massiliense TaxID=1280390 RepID=UPI0004B18346|nr:endonuclease/exonuclease/phosphatase family protein [Gorillibacterium massiliense]
MKRFAKIIGSFILAAVLLFAVLLLVLTITDYKPDEVIPLTASPSQNPIIKHNEPFSVTTFNIGYAGLDQNQDFFMDGGTMSRSSSKSQTLTNLTGLSSYLKKAESNIIFLQEVDTRSSRSYHINEADYMADQLPAYSHVFAANYNVPWVPVPLTHPMGSAHSGLLTLSSYKSTANTRYDLPGKESWPTQLFELDRAFLESRLPVDNGKELVLVNLHLSAFDKGGKIRKKQLNYLNAYIQKESEKGNYLLIGGDWNHALPDTDPSAFATTQEWPEWLQSFPDSFKPVGFQWAVDKKTPSVRTVDVRYTEGVNFRAVIDGFLVSPNIEIKSVEGTDLHYANSDHNPVTARFILR